VNFIVPKNKPWAQFTVIFVADFVGHGIRYVEFQHTAPSEPISLHDDMYHPVFFETLSDDVLGFVTKV
jgi:hypothetical protein